MSDIIRTNKAVAGTSKKPPIPISKNSPQEPFTQHQHFTGRRAATEETDFEVKQKFLRYYSQVIALCVSVMVSIYGSQISAFISLGFSDKIGPREEDIFYFPYLPQSNIYVISAKLNNDFLNDCWRQLKVQNTCMQHRTLNSLLQPALLCFLHCWGITAPRLTGCLEDSPSFLSSEVLKPASLSSEAEIVCSFASPPDQHCF